MNVPYPTKPDVGENWMIVDVETTGRDDIAHLLETPEPNRTLKDPAKIEADIAAKLADRDSKTALDFNTNRIVAITVLHMNSDEPISNVLVPKNEKGERDALTQLWQHQSGVNAFGPLKVIGYNIRSFDIPVLIQRTRLLGLPEPLLDTGRYSKDIVDLFELLTFGQGNTGTCCMRRRLKDYCKLFNIPQDDDDCSGSDVPALIAAGRTADVVAHCRADVLRTYELAKRIGVIR